MKTVAYAQIPDWEACRDTYLKIGYDLKGKLVFPSAQEMGLSQEEWKPIYRVYDSCKDKQYSTRFYDTRREETEEERHQRNLMETLGKLEEFVRFHQQYNTPIAVVYRTEDWGIFEFGEEHYILPLDCVVVREMKDYSHVGQRRLARLLNATPTDSGNELAEYDGETSAAMNEHIDAVRDSIQRAKQEMDDLYQCRTDELAERRQRLTGKSKR